MLITWDKDKDNKEKNIQRNKRNGSKEYGAPILRAFQRLQTSNLPAQNEKKGGLVTAPIGQTYVKGDRHTYPA
jgi:hypothetical protein